MKIGIEIEFWTVDQKGRLTSCEDISRELDFADKEFVKPLFEIKTDAFSEVEELKKQANSYVKEGIEAAERNGKKLVPAGTPLNSGNIETVESERARIQEKIIGENLRHAKKVAGTHIHFEKEDVKNQLNTLTALDPALSLLNSSPYYRGERIASSSRNQVYRNRCYREFPKHGQLWNYTDSVQEWKERRKKRFEEFREAGRRKGIGEEKIEEHFSVEDALWTPVRLREKFPTIEYRGPDTAMPSQINHFVEDIQSIVYKRQEESTSLPDFQEVKEVSRTGIEKGLTPDVEKYLSNLGFRTEAYKPLSQQIESGRNIDMKKAKKIRLDLAKKMKKDTE